jgi:hypothetical protein
MLFKSINEKIFKNAEITISNKQKETRKNVRFLQFSFRLNLNMFLRVVHLFFCRDYYAFVHCLFHWSYAAGINL